MIVLVPKENTDIPPLIEAMRVYPKAKQLGCDRIRIERVNGALVTEIPMVALEQTMKARGTVLTPNHVARPNQDYEFHRPIWMPGWTRKGE